MRLMVSCFEIWRWCSFPGCDFAENRIIGGGGDGGSGTWWQQQVAESLVTAANGGSGGKNELRGASPIITSNTDELLLLLYSPPLCLPSRVLCTTVLPQYTYHDSFQIQSVLALSQIDMTVPVPRHDPTSLCGIPVQ